FDSNKGLNHFMKRGNMSIRFNGMPEPSCGVCPSDINGGIDSHFPRKFEVIINFVYVGIEFLKYTSAKLYEVAFFTGCSFFRIKARKEFLSFFWTNVRVIQTICLDNIVTALVAFLFPRLKDIVINPCHTINRSHGNPPNATSINETRTAFV